MNYQNANSRRNQFGIVFGVATFIGFVFLVQSYLAHIGANQTFKWLEQLGQVMSYWYLWALFFPLIFTIAKHFRFDQGNKFRSLTVWVLAGILISVLDAAIHTFLTSWLFPFGGKPQPWTEVFKAALASTLFWRFLIYSTILTICLALNFYRRARETEIQSVRMENGILLAELESLKMQIDPDFLFKSLRRLLSLIHVNPDTADTLIARLGDYLRINLDNAGMPDVSLREEIEFLQCYLEIENQMARNPAEIELDIQPDAWNSRVPSLILQAPIEDAIRRRSAQDSVHLKIRVRKLNSTLELTITEPFLTAKNTESPRLHQLLERLNAFYQPSIKKNQTSSGPEELSTRLEVPLLLEKRSREENAEFKASFNEEAGFDARLDDTSNPISRWLLIIGIFTFLAVYFSTQTMLLETSKGRAMNWPGQLLNCTGWYIWALITPFVLKLSSKYPLQKRHFVKHFMIHMVGFIGSWIFANLAFAGVRWTANLGLTSYVSQLGLARTLGLDIVCYSTIVAVETALRYHRRLEFGKLRTVRLNSQLARARLNALKMQLHPHFLFNALNSLSQLMREDLKAAEEMIVNLEQFLRLTLSSNDSHEISLEGELEFLKCYLAIENIRFQDRLRITMKIDPEALMVLVPNLVLQPIVENAIKHGVAPRVTPGEVEIIATRQNGTLTVSVRDDGPGLSKSKRKEISSRTGLGLSNTRERLFQLYGNSHRFDLMNAPEGGLMVIVEIPADRSVPNIDRKVS